MIVILKIIENKNEKEMSRAGKVLDSVMTSQHAVKLSHEVVLTHEQILSSRSFYPKHL